MRIFLDMVGCKLNQAEIEQMARQFRAAGHTIVGAAGEADTMVVNTCSVTSEAASDSRQKVRQAGRAGVGKIIVTGCWSTLQPQQAEKLPNVVQVIPNNRKDNLVKDFLRQDIGEKPVPGSGDPSPQLDVTPFEVEPISRVPIPGLRHRTRAFIKVQDGCDNNCTFCITTIARGASQSRPLAEVVADIHAALNGGSREIVLTGVHLGAWGQDFGQHLTELITKVLKETNAPRLRLSSLEPWDLHEDFFSLWEDPRLCPHLHLPLQSGSAATLKRMLRKTTPDLFLGLVNSARKYIPKVAITTDLIAGFPGETDSEFAETMAFVRKLNLAGGHVFSYSVRPGTPAARIKEQVPLEVRKHRNHLLQSLLAESSAVYRHRFTGQTMPVLWEASAVRSELGWQIAGLTGNFIRVTATAPELRWNHIDQVHLTGLTGDGMSGEII
jgi:threonylcarbamoyladenosine tRNA methylthiotransferase MtaB